MAAEQNYDNHRRFFPPFHFVAMPALIINLGVEAARLNKYQTLYHVWLVVFALALIVFALTARTMALTAQNRVIRLEERLRLATLMPENQRAGINDLTAGQLIGLRFASDEEAPELAARCATGELKGSGDVKRAIRNWRADHLRV